MTAPELRITGMVMAPPGEPTFSERATRLAIADEGGGEFVEVDQGGSEIPGIGKIQIDPAEWPALRKAIDKLIDSCRGAA